MVCKGVNVTEKNSFCDEFVNVLSDADLYKLMDVISVEDAAALIAGVSPNNVYHDGYNGSEYVGIRVKQGEPYNAEDVFLISLKTLRHSIKSGRLHAHIVVTPHAESLIQDDLSKDWIAISDINTTKTTIDRNDLKEWLSDRGVYPHLLFPNGKKNDYMNQKHSNYSAKLALCVRAWEEAQTANLNGKRVKGFIEDWMKENAKSFGVTNTGDKFFNDLAAIPNWDTAGGRAKAKPTPLKTSKIADKHLSTEVQKKLTVNLPDKLPKLDDDFDIPF